MHNPINPHPRVTARVAYISPALAKHLIDKNLDNQRNIRIANLRKTENQMREGSFVLNGESIIVSDKGRLLDGNHRCHSSVNTGIGFWSVLVEGVPDEYFCTIDQGAPRSASDVAQVAGHDNTHHLMTAAARLAEYEQNPKSVCAQVPLSNSQKLHVVQRHPGLVEAVSLMHRGKIRHVISASQGAWLHYLTHAYARDLAVAFWQSLESGEMLRSDSPVYLLRARLISSKAGNKSARLRPRELQALLVKSWNAFALSRPVKVLKWGAEEEFPLLSLPTPDLRTAPAA